VIKRALWIIAIVLLLVVPAAMYWLLMTKSGFNTAILLSNLFQHCQLMKQVADFMTAFICKVFRMNLKRAMHFI